MNARFVALLAYFAITSVLCSLALSGQAEGDPKRGGQLFKSRCSGCHSLDANRAGPMLRGVYGRKAGTMAGYAYSSALAASGALWDKTTLDNWLRDPDGFVPGQKMFVRVELAADRSDVIAYLRTLSPAKPKAQVAP